MSCIKFNKYPDIKPTLSDFKDPNNVYVLLLETTYMGCPMRNLCFGRWNPLRNIWMIAENDRTNVIGWLQIGDYNTIKVNAV